ncbi:hypothetical protein L2E82_33125 [Cichorium intybus]|uniref:Uncharacterized protein n=1 Tax=Cichorium intybus TaxID=13427 RepID=A0ACB9BJB5_CICIN|nr:hypothetical protein L2E82_33125 [Cichorium intybus]
MYPVRYACLRKFEPHLISILSLKNFEQGLNIRFVSSYLGAQLPILGKPNYFVNKFLGFIVCSTAQDDRIIKF